MNVFYKNLEKNIIIFENNNIYIIIDKDETIWFNVSDIALSLGYKYSLDTILKNIDKEDKIKNHSIYINEIGLYSFILQSKLEKSKKFKSWITKKVLPTIRKIRYNKLVKIYENEVNEKMKKIKILEKQNKKLNDAISTKYKKLNKNI